MTKSLATLALATLVLVAGCEAPRNEEVVAVFGNHSLTLADIDRAILALPPEQRWPGDMEATDWYATVARREAVAQILLEQARLVGADGEPEFEQIERRIRRKVVSDHFLAEHGPPPPITDEDIRAHYEANRERFQRPEKRIVHHIYKRCSDSEGCAAQITELNEIRSRVLSGRRFQELATIHSESETRHNEGRLGAIERGDLSEDFDRVVFALPEGMPSEPVATGDGVHLFFVDNSIAAQNLGVEDVRGPIRRLLWTQRTGERLAALVEELPLPPDSLIPGWEEAQQLRRQMGPQAVLLRIGDFSLTASQFMGLLREETREQGPRQVPDYAKRRFDEIKYREIVYQHMLQQGVPEVAEAVAREEIERELATYFAQRRMRLLLEKQTERLTAHYEINKMRFTTPLRLGLRRLRIPLGEDPVARMSELEEAHRDLNEGSIDLDDLAKRLDGQIEELGPIPVIRLAQADPKAPSFALTLQVGEHSPPYRLGQDEIAIFRLSDRLEPRQLAYPMVRKQVLEHYLENYSAQVYKEVSDQILTDADFTLYRDRILPSDQDRAGDG